MFLEHLKPDLKFSLLYFFWYGRPSATLQQPHMQAQASIYSFPSQQVDKTATRSCQKAPDSLSRHDSSALHQAEAGQKHPRLRKQPVELRVQQRKTCKKTPNTRGEAHDVKMECSMPQNWRSKRQREKANWETPKSE